MRTTKLLALFGVVFGLTASLSGCPAQGRPSYDPCERNADCMNGDTCVAIAFGTAERSICTRQRCLVDTDCALDARGVAGECLTFTGGLATCFERCATRANCAEGWSCESVAPASGGAANVCVPLP